ncbi:glycosyltransferase family 25 protein [Nitratireductor aquimarinus]|uniref:glycosyltransferase family 25 protein n=1 Tax=Nitratireductor aquimarinus TaxID=889300 RepID=UPI001A8DF4B5|nr:glycosyltransferase family 25 protein [Nitratireductor aquimarinus]MBN8243318.1 glycosyltransferase family 25 protein [Nitratireductor aquimarinus]MBY6131219.1 glycosyltransferase family 25 protein [Nitratireductor aquimarinus]MCA1302025.1 glycosyltransferase family 25 protein [Nitratireductor aquimarinus]
MKIYVINLDRAEDRMSKMRAQLSDLGLPFERVPAVDGSMIDRSRFPHSQRINGEIGCSLSHCAAWQALLRSTDKHALILEDDAVLSRDLASLLENTDLIPADADLLKLETTTAPTVLARMKYATVSGRQIRRLIGRHTGTAGYIISRDFAEKAIAKVARADVPVDIALFDEDAVKQAVVYQVDPAPVIQEMFASRNRNGAAYEADSLTAMLCAHEMPEKKPRPRGLKLVWREITRPFRRMYALFLPKFRFQLNHRNGRRGPVPFA